MKNALRKLSEMYGITSSYVDKMNKVHYTSDSLRKYFLKSDGIKNFSEKYLEKKIKQIENNPWLNGFDYTYSFFDNEKVILNFCIYQNCIGKIVNFEFIDSNGVNYIFNKKIMQKNVIETKKIDGKKYIKLSIIFNKKFSPDYYNLTAKIENMEYKTFVIIAPKSSFLPKVIQDKKKILGVQVQLYSLQSKKSMGIGDFSCLKEFLKLAKEYGCDFVGVNPLGVMSFKAGKDVSPYRVLSREYINYIYLDLTDIKEFKQSLEIKKLTNSEKYKKELCKLQNSEFIDYKKVFDFKLALLKKMYKQFKSCELLKNTMRANMFKKYCKIEGQKLENLCMFEVLLGKNNSYWKNWEKDLQNINSEKIQKLKKQYNDSIEFFKYAHWLSDMQLIQVKKLSSDLKMKIGIYLDIPVGAGTDGVEVWEKPNNFADNVDIGTPPDTIRPKGQTWGLTPPNPFIMKKNCYKDFSNLLRKTMQYAGAIRLDHSFSLLRLFWVSQKNGGAYINYNFKDMTAILCLESYKNKCLVIGEDLGNVPDGFPEMMSKHNIFSNKILFRQKDENGNFLDTNKYPYYALCQVSTHDQATSCGYWISEDIKINKKCNLFPLESQYLANLSERQEEREDFFKILEKTKSFYNNKQSFIDNIKGNDVPKNLEYSFNIYGAKTSCAIYLVKAVDIFGQTAMENVPSTVDEYPNWRLKFPIKIEDIKKDGRMKKLFYELKKYR